MFLEAKTALFMNGEIYYREEDRQSSTLIAKRD
ncbi:hypothetical protein FOXB_09263 [Fusarium oxysporum f. sp. conglutinans Fo5176]|uniref:Uncharacterized protein n=1 Tax=Fusarium oxysporum (strain Fo5176) TaxID=660025 RepID=F9FS82_FUSOF|nr:hypothetical protein FOXB_09263 [Fusarium oxysporum f. sp. conglutinans Fo5176]